MFMSNKAGVQKRDQQQRQSNEHIKLPTPVHIASAVAGAPDIRAVTVTFNAPVVLQGLPDWTIDVAGATLESATSPNPTTVQFNYDVDVSLATTLTIPYSEKHIRSKRGGYVADSTFAL